MLWANAKLLCMHTYFERPAHAAWTRRRRPQACRHIGKGSQQPEQGGGWKFKWCWWNRNVVLREHSTPSKHHPTWGLFGPICSCLTGWTPADTNFWCCGGGMLRSAWPWTDRFTSASRRPQLLFQYWYLITPGAVAPKIVGVPASLVQSCPDRRWCMLLLSAHCKIPCQFFKTLLVCLMLTEGHCMCVTDDISWDYC